MQVCGKDVVIEGKLIRIARLDAEGYQFLEDPDGALDDFRKSDQRIDLFTFIQRLSDPASRYGHRMELDNMAVLRVSTFDNWMKNQIDFKARNKVRKADKKGVLVREVPFDDALIQGIYAIYNESPLRQGKRFWHYGKDAATIRKMNEGALLNRSIFLGAFFQDNLIGFVKLVTNEDKSQAGLMQIISMIQHRDKAPTNALIAQAVRSCTERGIPYLWYANFAYGKKQTGSLAEFKRHNGFQKIDVPRYYVPLTVVGRVALRLGLHKSAKDWIPEPVARAFRKIRSSWYSRIFSTNLIKSVPPAKDLLDSGN